MYKPLPSNPELELAICRDESKNDDIWHVYSDWLQSVGHPMGEIIAMELACLDEKNRTEMETKLRRHIQETYPDWGKGFYSELDDMGRFRTIRIRIGNSSEINLHWGKGFLSIISLRANLHENHGALLEQFKTILSSSYSRLFSYFSIRFSLDPPEDSYDEDYRDDQPPQPFKSPEVAFAEILRILSETGTGKYLVNLELDAMGKAASVESLDIAPLLSYFPNLRELEVQGEFGISKLKKRTLKYLTLLTDGISPAWHRVLSAPRIPKLKYFSLSSTNYDTPLEGNISFLLENEAFQHLSNLDITLNNANKDCLEAFSKLSFPKLRSLYITLVDEKKELSHWKLFQPFFQNVSLPALTDLDITLDGYESEFLSAILNSPLLPRLKRLGVSGKFEGDDSVQPFLEQAESFLHLKNLRIYEVKSSTKVEQKLYDVYGKKVLKLHI